MAYFELLKIKACKEKDLDTAIKSTSENGTVVTRMPYTKIRKSFEITPVKASTKEEKDELKNLFDVVRTVTPFTFYHPYEDDEQGNPIQYTVRFKENIEISKDAEYAGYYVISPFTLEEV